MKSLKKKLFVVKQVRWVVKTCETQFLVKKLFHRKNSVIQNVVMVRGTIQGQRWAIVHLAERLNVPGFLQPT